MEREHRVKTSLAPQREESQQTKIPPRRRRCFGPFQASQVKRMIMNKYCRGQLSFEQTTRIFETFGELKGA